MQSTPDHSMSFRTGKHFAPPLLTDPSPPQFSTLRPNVSVDPKNANLWPNIYPKGSHASAELDAGVLRGGNANEHTRSENRASSPNTRHERRKGIKAEQNIKRFSENVISLMVERGMIEESKRNANVTILIDLLRKKIVSLDDVLVDTNRVTIRNTCIASTGYITYA